MASNPKLPHDTPRRPGARLPPDLTTAESDLACWFGHLERRDAPAALRQAVLAREAVAAAPSRGWWHAVPFGAWGVASAALLLAALGIAVTVELVDPVAPETARTAAQVRTMPVVQDGSIPLFHDLETFDDIGLSPGELIADWGR